MDVSTRTDEPLDEATTEELRLMMARLQEQRVLLEPEVIEGEAKAID